MGLALPALLWDSPPRVTCLAMATLLGSWPPWLRWCQSRLQHRPGSHRRARLPGCISQPFWAAAWLGGSWFVNTCVFGTFAPLGCVIALNHTRLTWPNGALPTWHPTQQLPGWRLSPFEASAPSLGSWGVGTQWSQTLRAPLLCAGDFTRRGGVGWWAESSLRPGAVWPGLVLASL